MKHWYFQTWKQLFHNSKGCIYTFRNAEIKCSNWCMAGKKFKRVIFDRKVFIHSTQSEIITALLSPSATLELGFDEWTVYRALNKVRSFNLMTERHEAIVRTATKPACLVIPTNFGGNGKYVPPWANSRTIQLQFPPRATALHRLNLQVLPRWNKSKYGDEETAFLLFWWLWYHWAQVRWR